MVKNWADHCSSDEEDAGVEDEPVEVPNPDVLKKQIEAENKAFQDAVDDEDEDEAMDPAAAEATTPVKRTYEFPTEAPFTAYVGNLAYSIMDPQDLTEKLTALVKDVLETDIKITDSRIMMERRNPTPKPRHRGFAYVQVETLDMLKTLMELNDKEAQLMGRQLTLDTSTTSNNNRRNNNTRNEGGGAGGNVPDGAQFRGGRFGNRDRRSSSQQQQPPQRRQFEKREEGDAAAPQQRPSLKLAPRTKPLQEGGPEVQSNIFGGGKARDESVWQERRKSNTRNDEPAGRAGRGGRSGERRSGRTNGGRSQRSPFNKDNKDSQANAKNNNSTTTSTTTTANNAPNKDRNQRGKGPPPPPQTENPAPAPTNPTKVAEKPTEKKVINKFAALDFSDSE